MCPMSLFSLMRIFNKHHGPYECLAHRHSLVGVAEGFLVYIFKQRNYNVGTERNILEIWATSNGGVIL